MRAAIEQLLAGMMEVRADARPCGELAGAKLAAADTVDAAIPRTEIAVGEHAVGKLAAELQQARPVGGRRQRSACPDVLPTRQKDRHQAIELGPQGFLAAACGIELGSERRGDAELGRPAVLRHVEVPRQRAGDRGVVPNSQSGQVAHGPAPGAYLVGRFQGLNHIMQLC
jgi:hypothetical protein